LVIRNTDQSYKYTNKLSVQQILFLSYSVSNKINSLAMKLLVLACLPLAISAMGLAGGKNSIPLSDVPVEVTNFANVAFTDYTSSNGFISLIGSTDQVDTTQTKITKATSQVVAGVLYNLTFDVMTLGQRHMECNVAVWSQPWLTGDDKIQVSGKPGCQDLPSKRGLVGGSSNADVHSAEVQGALAFAVKMMNSQENSMYHRKQVGTFTVTKQVVAGMKYVFSGLQMATTDCTKSQSNPDLDSCNVTSNSRTLTCSVTVVHKAWETPEYTLVGFSGPTSCQ